MAGMIFQMWVGLRMTEAKWEKVQQKVPFGEDRHWEYWLGHGVHLEPIYTFQQFVGYGVVIFRHQWNMSLVDLDEVRDKQEKALAILEWTFREWGIKGKLETWCLCMSD